MVKNYMVYKNEELLVGLQLKELVDMMYYLNVCLDMMFSNLIQGVVLVVMMLILFFCFCLVFWVMVGLLFCFLGVVMLMFMFSVSVNIFLLFVFIMVLGIVVDDVIVIGESVYFEIELKGGGVDNVICGVKCVVILVIFGVLIIIVVFVFFILSSGFEGEFFYNIVVVVILCLVFSLIEFKLIFFVYIVNIKFKFVKFNGWCVKFNNCFNQFVNGLY